ncbi:MAG: dihydrolipoyl dehydrogenase [Candidatus Thermoplasmatota archaeon]|nr:dihydrolipoyl dehydrogenase [Candidatus Thermoplasmatota archaeon]
MREYNIIAVGTGSAMSIVTQALNDDPDLDIAVIENEKPGGICLTRGCIPSKMMLYPAEVINHIQEADRFGIDVDIKSIDFERVMKRMKNHVDSQSENIEKNLKESTDLDFFQTDAVFIDDYTLEVENKEIKGEKIILGTGSRPAIPPIDNLEKVGYHTSKSLLDIEDLPKSFIVIGGGYIAAEYGYFLGMMGAEVTIIGRNPQFVPSEEKEVSEVLENKLSKYMDIHTGYEVKKVKEKSGNKWALAVDNGGKKIQIKGEDILVATGRRSNSDILKPEKSGIKTDERGWIKVDDNMKTSKENIWAFGDATGKHMFKHVANYEAKIVYQNAIEGRKSEVDYHAVPHAIFTYPQVAAVGMKEAEASKEHDILVGHYPFEETAKGLAMDIEDYFVKVIVDSSDYRILGAHIIGPQASVLIQEVVNLMYTEKQNFLPIYHGMHIHPSLSEVVERAFSNLHSHQHQHH